MFKNRAGQYTVPESYGFTKALAQVWKITFLVHITFILCFSLGSALAVRIYGDTIITSANFQKVYTSGSIADIFSGFVVFEVLMLGMCLLFQSVLSYAKDTQLSWPVWVTGVCSLFSGIFLMNIASGYVKNLYQYSLQFNDDPTLHKALAEALSPSDLTKVYDLLAMFSLGAFLFSATVAVLALTTSTLGVLALMETRKRKVLPAKTLKPVVVKEYDGLHSSREVLHKIVIDSLQDNVIYTKEQKDEIFARVEENLKSNQSYVIFEGHKAVGFITRSNDYKEILEIWVRQDRRRRHFGQVLVYFYLNAARDRHTEMPLLATVPSKVREARALLENLGWQELRESDSDTIVFGYREKEKSFFV